MVWVYKGLGVLDGLRSIVNYAAVTVSLLTFDTLL